MYYVFLIDCILIIYIYIIYGVVTYEYWHAVEYDGLELCERERISRAQGYGALAC